MGSSSNIAEVKIWRIPTFSVKEEWRAEDSPWPTVPINFLVRVTLENGIFGIGEISTQLWYLNETPEQIQSAIQLCDDCLRGADIANVALCHELMLKTYGGGSIGARGARSGVDMAIWDAIGKLYSVPVFKLLGGGNPAPIPLMFCTYETTPERVAKECEQALSRNYSAIKVKVGDSLLAAGWSHRALVAENDKIAAALEVIPKEIMVDADANQAWGNAGSAVAALRVFQGHSNLSIEQPLHLDDLSGSAYVRKTAGFPLILDESVWSAEAMIAILKAEACDRVVCKINRLGGLSEARKVVAISEAAGVGVSVDTAPYTILGDTSACHLAASCKTTFPFDEGHLSMININGPNPFSGGAKSENGNISLPDAEGYGIEVDWDIVEGW
ncbi:mandelate racemase/muconate lactonizing enzyme family protein [Mesorhizobium sp. CA4]|uniref:mandelate racemase/muconate lactonizing enzyme family protein n=1 Tax=Mesorhizobium sp. CA4 TaxID=588499 RepID=UPI001CD1872B|nr:mandelate racemase/muconate lactonizing enzyme family protein [Mesorhizobium sp. CA4]MBZ9823569.1 mandelate racemase/muconate lactonizing enzyme family protein [Mesorhizobium sp. CA4]